MKLSIVNENSEVVGVIQDIEQFDLSKSFAVSCVLDDITEIIKEEQQRQAEQLPQ